MDLLFRIPMLAALVEFAHVGFVVATTVTLVMMFGVRFVTTDWVIYRMPRLRMPNPAPSPPASGRQAS